jgi:hypothetical protein
MHGLSVPRPEAGCSKHCCCNTRRYKRLPPCLAAATIKPLFKQNQGTRPHVAEDLQCRLEAVLLDTAPVIPCIALDAPVPVAAGASKLMLLNW